MNTPSKLHQALLISGILIFVLPPAEAEEAPKTTVRNNVTAKKAKDRSVTIHFGGDSKVDNFLPIVPGWNYIIGMYQPCKAPGRSRARKRLSDSWV